MTDDKPKPYHSKSEMRRIEHMKEQKPDQPRGPHCFAGCEFRSAYQEELKLRLDLEDHCEALQKRCEELEKLCELHGEQHLSNEAREQALVEALKFYANEENWETDLDDNYIRDGQMHRSKSGSDQGEIAKQAFKKHRGGK